MRIYLLLFLCSITHLAWGQLNTFENMLSSAWNQPQNWSLGQVPTSAHDVQIGGSTFFPNTMANAVIDSHAASAGILVVGLTSGKPGTLYIQNSGSLTVGLYTIIGLTTHGSIILSTGGDFTCAGSVYAGYTSSAKTSISLHGAGTTFTAQLMEFGADNDCDVTVDAGARMDVGTFDTDLSVSSTSLHTITLLGAGNQRGVIAVGHFRNPSSGHDPLRVVFDGGELEAKPSTSLQADVFANFGPGQVALQAGGGFFNSAGQDMKTSAAIGGTGKLTKVGAGTLRLRGANTYTGSTEVRSGTLEVSGQIVHGAVDLAVAPTGNAIASVVTGGNVFVDEAILGGATGSPDGQLLLHGGTLESHRVRFIGGDHTLSFNGGRWKARSAVSEIFQDQGADSISVSTIGSGAVIDSAGFDVVTGRGFSGSGAVTKVGAGSFRIWGGSSHSGGTFINEGTFISQSFSGSSTGTGPVQVAVGATFTGDGTVNGPTQIAGTLIPGQFSNRMTFGSSLTLQPQATTRLTLRSLGLYQQMTVTGSLTYGGTLQLIFDNYTPRPGDQFPIFVPGSTTSGSFSAITLNRSDITVAMNYQTGVLTVLTAPLPQLELIRSSGQVELRWPLAHSGWTLLYSATLAPGSWLPVTQTVSANSTHHRVLIPMPITQPRMFYTLSTN
jgi:autotransporter-associated beta strand protein